MPTARVPFDQPGEAILLKGSQQPQLNNKNRPVSQTKAAPAQTGYPAFESNRRKKLQRYLLLLAGLIMLALALSGCTSYPGADPPCQGANAGAPGCANPVGNLFSQAGTLPWFVDWVFQIIKALVVGLGITAVELAVSVFWLIFNNLSSTDFYACTQSGSSSNPTCAATSAFQEIRTIAMVLLPLVLSWKIFKNYFIGGFIPPLFESAISFLPKIGIGVLVLSQLELIVSSAFGLSNLAFNAILGNPQSLSNTALAILGDNNSGVGGLAQVASVPILMVLNSMCMLLAVIFVLLGVLFILRTVIIFILMVLGPLAIMAGLTDEFKPHFYKWLQGLQSMLIAPLPVAVCFRLISTYVTTVPNPSSDPAGFFLRLVYVESFLLIGGILMFKIAGQTGEMLFGVVVGALGAIAGFLTGGAALAAVAGSGSATGSEKGQSATASPALGSNGGATTGLEGALAGGSSESGGFSPARAGVSTAPISFSSGSGSGSSDLALRQQQEQVTQAMRSLAESMAANRYAEAMQKLYQQPAASSARPQPQKSYNYQADRNLQNFLHAAGAAAGLRHAPHLSFAPVPGGGGSGSSSATPSPSSTEEEINGEPPLTESEVVTGEVEASISAPPTTAALNGPEGGPALPPPPPTTALPAGRVPPPTPLAPGGVTPLLPRAASERNTGVSVTTPQLWLGEAVPPSARPSALTAGRANSSSSYRNSLVLPAMTPNTPSYFLPTAYEGDSEETYFDGNGNNEGVGLLPAPLESTPVVFNWLTDPYGYDGAGEGNNFKFGSARSWERAVSQAEEAHFIEIEPERLAVPTGASSIGEVTLMPTTNPASSSSHGEIDLAPAPSPSHNDTITSASQAVTQIKETTPLAVPGEPLKTEGSGVVGTSESILAAASGSTNELAPTAPGMEPSLTTGTRS